jgi:hypothetical protein
MDPEQPGGPDGMKVDRDGVQTGHMGNRRSDTWVTPWFCRIWHAPFLGIARKGVFTTGSKP